MAKDPAFLFYPGDYISGTMGMTFEEKGAYIELLMLQFNRGHMTNDMIGRTVGQLWDNIKDKFIEDGDGKFYNVRLEEEQNKRKSFTASRRNNRKGTNQHSRKRGHTTSRMENENENKDNNTIKGNILNSKIWYEPIFMKRKVELEKGETYLKLFLDKQEDLIGEGNGLNRDELEIKNHFVSWLDIELKKGKNGFKSTNTGSNRSEKTGQRQDYE